ncbi:zinc metalloproteinase nas-13-like protein [Dinothrombium tinctorium]|uniref:Metalloendopeptidase n=1 Tax=Dinothrombium tinctorium TaxID=1965070 RepID=A0A443QPR4_9ACAR|nr:zinc metalloproteinase nas-13-like protein [Dinothrombium tinctorium]
MKSLQLFALSFILIKCCLSVDWITENSIKLNASGICTIEADISCPDEEIMGRKASKARAWDLPIHIVIVKDFEPEEGKILREVLNYLSKVTCLTFVEGKTNGAYLEVERGAPQSGCHTPAKSVGMHGNFKHTINLEPSCISHHTFGHELLHVLGFLHEQNRPDRDDYVYIFFDNVLPYKRDQYDKAYTVRESIYDMTAYEYDECSIMHYSITAFRLYKFLPTIIPTSYFVNPFMMGPHEARYLASKYYSFLGESVTKRAKFAIQRFSYGFSNLDIQKIRDLYCKPNKTNPIVIN